MNPLNIILLEDSEVDADLIERELHRAGMAFALRVVDTRPEFEKALQDFPPDVIVSDHSMPQFNSIEAFEIFRQYQENANVLIPFILVTGEVSEEFAVQCLKAGVDDYVLKDRLKRLPLAIQGAIEKCRAKKERLEYLREVMRHEALMREAGHLARLASWEADFLTGKHTWSEEMYVMLGYEKGEITPGFDSFFDLVHPHDVVGLRKGLEAGMRDRNELGCEFRIIDRKGRMKHLSSKLEVQRDVNGQVVRLVGFNMDITERKEAEVRVQKSEQEYKSLFDQNPDPVFSFDLTGTFTNANSAVLEVTGLSREELRRLDFRSFMSPCELPRVNEHFMLAIQGKPQRFEATTADHTGRTMIMDVMFMPVLVDNEIIGVHGIAKDVTRKKELESLLEKAYRFARIGGWEMDAGDGKIRWSSITREIHEVPDDFQPDLETGIAFYREGEDRATIRRAVERCIAYGEAYDLELRIVTGKGNERWVRATGEAQMKDGACVRMFGTFQDIHERKSAVEALKETYEEKIHILESIHDGFFAVDRNWTVTYWNTMAENLLRMPRDKMLGRNLWEIYADAVPLQFYTQYHRAMAENIPIHFEEFYPPLDTWFEVNTYPSEAGLSIYFKDITDKKNYVREIERQNEQLREIARIQSHEVRAPLARILGLVSLLREEAGCSPQVAALLKDIDASASELDAVVRKIVRRTEEV